MKDKSSYQERLKKMKQSVDENKRILESDFPDDVTHMGSPDLVKKSAEGDFDEEFDGDSDEE